VHFLAIGTYNKRLRVHGVSWIIPAFSGDDFVTLRVKVAVTLSMVLGLVLSSRRMGVGGLV
jgi:hypothetical protein